MILTVAGLGDVEITNWDAFSKELLTRLGLGISQAMQDEAMKLGLFRSGRYIRGFHHYIDKEGVLNIDNDVYYAIYLEYGTFDYWDLYGLDDYPEKPLKKMNLTPEERIGMPKGMMPFAPMRRILYSQEKIDQIIKEWF